MSLPLMALQAFWPAPHESMQGPDGWTQGFFGEQVSLAACPSGHPFTLGSAAPASSEAASARKVAGAGLGAGGHRRQVCPAREEARSSGGAGGGDLVLSLPKQPVVGIRKASSGRLLTGEPVQPVRLGIPGASGGRMYQGPGLGLLRVGQQAGASRSLCSCQV